MDRKRTLARGSLTLAILAVVAGALIASPSGAAAPLTKKKVKKIATKVVKQLGPQLFYSRGEILALADTDTQPGAVDVNNLSDPLVINSSQFTAPTSGVLLITGSVHILAQEGGSNRYSLEPEVDGQPVSFGANQLAASGAEFTLSYTVGVQVAAGSHTITHQMTSGAPIDFNYNGNQLTAVFSPTGTLT